MPATILKETPTQVLPVKLPKIFKNNLFEKYLQTAASLTRLPGWVKVKKITERSSH